MTADQKKKFLAIITALHDIIIAHGSDGIPSGHLYARLMGKMDLHTYQTMIDILTNAGMIKHTGYLLKSL